MPDEVSFDGAVDEFLDDTRGGAEETEDEAPKPKKEQPAKQAKTGGEKKDQKPAAKAEADDDSSDDDEDDASSKKDAEKPKDGPWKAELAKRGIDTPEVNDYMAQVVQPYITRLEQQGGPIAALFEGNEEAASIAAGILEGLDADPANTVAQLINLLDISDEDINKALESAGVETDGDESQIPESGTDEDDGEETPEMKWIRERMEAEQQQSESEAYDQFLKTIEAEFGEGFDADLFNLAVASTENLEDAMELYPSLQEKFGAPAAKPAPPVMGRNRRGQSPLPEQKEYDGSNDGWEAAFDDYFAEDKARKGR